MLKMAANMQAPAFMVLLKIKKLVYMVMIIHER